MQEEKVFVLGEFFGCEIDEIRSLECAEDWLYSQVNGKYYIILALSTASNTCTRGWKVGKSGITKAEAGNRREREIDTRDEIDFADSQNTSKRCYIKLGITLCRSQSRVIVGVMWWIHVRHVWLGGHCLYCCIDQMIVGVIFYCLVRKIMAYKIIRRPFDNCIFIGEERTG